MFEFGMGNWIVAVKGLKLLFLDVSFFLQRLQWNYQSCSYLMLFLCWCAVVLLTTSHEKSFRIQNNRFPNLINVSDETMERLEEKHLICRDWNHWPGWAVTWTLSRRRVKMSERKERKQKVVNWGVITLYPGNSSDITAGSPKPAWSVKLQGKLLSLAHEMNIATSWDLNSLYILELYYCLHWRE